jgi:hypothetical protein
MQLRLFAYFIKWVFVEIEPTKLVQMPFSDWELPDFWSK